MACLCSAALPQDADCGYRVSGESFCLSPGEISPSSPPTLRQIGILLFRGQCSSETGEICRPHGSTTQPKPGWRTYTSITRLRIPDQLDHASRASGDKPSASNPLSGSHLATKLSLVSNSVFNAQSAQYSTSTLIGCLPAATSTLIPVAIGRQTAAIPSFNHSVSANRRVNSYRLVRGLGTEQPINAPDSKRVGRSQWGYLLPSQGAFNPFSGSYPAHNIG